MKSKDIFAWDCRITVKACVDCGEPMLVIEPTNKRPFLRKYAFIFPMRLLGELGIGITEDWSEKELCPTDDTSHFELRELTPYGNGNYISTFKQLIHF